MPEESAERECHLGDFCTLYKENDSEQIMRWNPTSVAKVAGLVSIIWLGLLIGDGVEYEEAFTSELSVSLFFTYLHALPLCSFLALPRLPPPKPHLKLKDEDYSCFA